MKILKIERIPPHTHLHGDDTRIGTYNITYKLKGNKHHTMTVFGTNEMQAFTRALEALNRMTQGELK
jgi:hypothetical protein